LLPSPLTDSEDYTAVHASKYHC